MPTPMQPQENRNTHLWVYEVRRRGAGEPYGWASAQLSVLAHVNAPESLIQWLQPTRGVPLQVYSHRQSVPKLSTAALRSAAPQNAATATQTFASVNKTSVEHRQRLVAATSSSSCAASSLAALGVAGSLPQRLGATQSQRRASLPAAGALSMVCAAVAE